MSEKVKKTKKADLFTQAVTAMDGSKAADFHAMPEPPAEEQDQLKYQTACAEATKINAIAKSYYGDEKLLKTMKAKLVERTEKFVRDYGRTQRYRSLLTEVTWNEGGMIFDKDAFMRVWHDTFHDAPLPQIAIDDIEAAKELLTAQGVPDLLYKKQKESYLSHRKEAEKRD